MFRIFFFLFSILFINLVFAYAFFQVSITPEDLKNNYSQAVADESKKFKILIVPGHDNGNWGTEYTGVREADLNVQVAEYLTQLLRKEKQFEVYLLRNSEGYDSYFLNYVSNNKNVITDFINKHKNEMLQLLETGQIDSVNGVEHINAPTDVVMMLYGANKWANDLDSDIVIHLHFNDYPRRFSDQEGKYSGFSIYIPEKQYSNATSSRAVAESVAKSLNKFFATSNYEKEGYGTGIVEDQELIAIGAYNTLKPASLLVEYGYIYEPQFTHPDTREFVLRELAFQTYLGIKRYFDVEDSFSAYVLPYYWEKNLKKGIKQSKDVFALQTFLASKGHYPPTGLNLNDCPITGNFGDCTFKAVQQYQSAVKIYPVSGYIGPVTRAKLNATK